MTRQMHHDRLVRIWGSATGRPFHRYSTTARGLRAVLVAISENLVDGPERDLWQECFDLRKILDDLT